MPFDAKGTALMRTPLGLVMSLLLAAGVFIGTGCDNKTLTVPPAPVSNGHPAVTPNPPDSPDANAAWDPGGPVDELPDIPTDPARNTGPSARR